MRTLAPRALCLTLALAVAGPLLANAPASEPVSLRPELTEGYEARVVFEMTKSTTQIIKMEMPGGASNENTTKGDLKVGFLMKVIRSDEKGAAVTLRVDDIDFKAEGIWGEYSWKSTDPRRANDGQNRALTAVKPALGATITINFDADRNISSVDNGGVSIPVNSDLQDYIRAIASPQEVRLRWGQVFAPRREGGAVKVGDTWSTENRMQMQAGVFTITTDYALESATETAATATVGGNFVLGSVVEDQPPPFKVESSSVEGTLAWDRTVGLFRSLDIHQKVAIDGNAGGFPIGFRTDSTTKIRREDKPAEAK